MPNFALTVKLRKSSKFINNPVYMLNNWWLCLYSSNLGTFWLKIKQFWPFEEISIFSNGGHLGYRTALTDTILKGEHLRIISAKFGLLAMWFLVRIYFFNLTNHKKEMLATAMMKSVAFEIIFNDVLGQSNNSILRFLCFLKRRFECDLWSK